MPSCRRFARTRKIVHNARQDFRYGGFLGGRIKTRYPHLGAKDVSNSDYDELAVLFRLVEIGPEDVFVDIGCGKGRAINKLLSSHPSLKIYGFELDQDVCWRTARRLRRFPNVTIRCGDATQLLPADGTIFYLFNPFDETVMRRFIDALLELAKALPQLRRRVVYYNAQSLHLYHQNRAFEVREVAVSELRHPLALIDLRA